MKAFLQYLAGTAMVVLVAPTAAAQAPADQHHYVIEAQELGAALRAFSRVSGRDILVDATILEGKRSARVAGDYDADTALARLLRRSGLRVALVDGGFVVQRGDGQATEGNADDIVVTGTRIRGAAPAGSPVSVIDRVAIERSGRGTVQSLFETIPSNFGGGLNEAVSGNTARNGAGGNGNFGSSINLRGLGANSTLVLFDNVRPANAGAGGTFADISLIPLVAIDRVEILTDGASAIYGSDAVAGVVNFRFRNRFEGQETTGRIATADGASQEYQFGQLLGRRWTNGGIVLAYQFSQRTTLSGSSRDFSTEDLRRYGGIDYRSEFSAPGTIVVADGRRYAIPPGQDGRSLSSAALLPGVTNLTDMRRRIDLLPAQMSHSAYASFDQSLGENVNLYARGLYARRTFHTRRTSYQPASPVIVTPDNPYYVDPIGTGEPVSVLYDFSTDLGLPEQSGSVDGVSVTAGVSARRGGWAFDLSGSYGFQIEHFEVRNVPNSARLDAALSMLDPNQAYNVFGDGNDTPAAVVAGIRGSARQRSRSEVWTGAVRADGPVFGLPAGELRLATGYEHRRESLDFRGLQDITQSIPVDQNFPGLPAQRDVDAVYAELLIPVASGDAQWLPGRLDLSLAARQEWYSDVGRAFNPKAGMSWQLLDGLRFCASYGKSFRAPSFPDQVGDRGNLIIALALPDPSAATGATPVIGQFGFAPKIGPEKADSLTAGFDVTNWPIDGLKVSASYFDIRYRDRIDSASAEFFTFLTRRDLYGAFVQDSPSPALVAQLFADPRFVNPDGFAPGDIGAVIDGRTQNLARVAITGIDFDVRYQHSIAGGLGTMGLTGTRLLAIDRQIASASPTVNVVSVLGNPVRLRLRGSSGWERGGVSINAFVNYTGNYQNQTTVPAEPVRSQTTVDATLAYRFSEATPLKGASLALSATNVFDRNPPYVAYHNFDQTLAFDPEQASPLGRTLSVQLSLQW